MDQDDLVAGAMHRIRITISFEEPMDFEGTMAFDWQGPYHTCGSDSVVVSNGGIEICFTRSNRPTVNKIINKTRVGYLQRTLLALACLNGNGVVPRFRAVAFSVDGGSEKEVELPTELCNLGHEYSGLKFSRSAIDRCLGESPLARFLRIAVSYCWAASRAFSEEERLKLLWGAFNALYRRHAQSVEPRPKFEVGMLDEVNNLFLREEVLDQALRVFEDTIGDGYQDFVRWKYITSDKSSAFYIKKAEKSDGVDKKKKRLQTLDRETLRCMRDFGCGDVAGKQYLKNAISESIDAAEGESSLLRKASMLLCRYTYLFRCDGVHANVEYPVFEKDGMGEKCILANLLEAAVIDLADWLAREGCLDERA